MRSTKSRTHRPARRVVFVKVLLWIAMIVVVEAAGVAAASSLFRHPHRRHDHRQDEVSGGVPLRGNPGPLDQLAVEPDELLEQAEEAPLSEAHFVGLHAVDLSTRSGCCQGWTGRCWA